MNGGFRIAALALVVGLSGCDGRLPIAIIVGDINGDLDIKCLRDCDLLCESLEVGNIICEGQVE